MTAQEAPNGTYAPDRAGPPPTTAGLLSGIVDDAQTLVQQQIRMARAEFQEDMDQTKSIAQYFGAAGVLFALGLVLVMFSLVSLLEAVFPELPESAARAIVGVVSLALGGLCVYIASRILKAYNPLPDKTYNALTENLSWLKKHQN